MSYPVFIGARGTKVIATVIVNAGGERSFDLAWDTGTEWAAALLAAAIGKAFGDRIQEIRSREYDRGWADAKAKRAKQTEHFDPSLWVPR